MKNKPLLILDLDETLIHATESILGYPSNFQVFHYHIYLRPYLHKFLTEIQEFYQLAIWSSASDDYVTEVVKKPFQLLFRYSLYGEDLDALIN